MGATGNGAAVNSESVAIVEATEPPLTCMRQERPE